ncbi:sodium/proline symporter PutP [Gallaecimonas sp. GXIMD4217]|uniref:sodium/proline symporter PutP n=1 Tax=Gallaecimonas sp. GXIMD4217 TaxID=3131927 RepID=UPI00311B2657
MPIIITFLAYLLLLLSLGLLAYRKTDDFSDYVLGGRKMGPAVTALSAGASDMSGWLLLGLPGAVYLSGISEIWLGLGLVIGAYINWLLIAKRLRIYTYHTDDALTLPDFLGKRFGEKSQGIRAISALTILLFFTFYTSAGLVGGAKLFEQVFELPYYWALVIGGGVIVSYTFVGGFFAVCWTDFFQGLLMLLALLLVPAVVLSSLGGAGQVEQDLASLHPELLDVWHGASLVGIVSLLAWGLGYFGQPHILARFMAIESPQAVPSSRRIAMGWMVLALVGAVLTGLAGRLYFEGSPLEDAETVFIFLSQALFSPWVAGIIVAAILSAIMSTVDSQLLICSSVLTDDIYKPWLRPKASDKELMWVGRFGVLAVAVVAMVIAANPESTVLELVGYAWAGFGSAFGPVVILSLFWRRFNLAGALATIITGALVVVLWPMLGTELYEMVPGFGLALLAGIVASLITPAPSAQVQQTFDEVRAQL